MTGLMDYSLFGLHIRSEISLPELLRVNRVSDPDVTIRLGQTPDAVVDRPKVQNAGRDHSLAIPGVGQFLVRNGSEIIVQPDPGVADCDVRLFLLGSAMGALLHQRELLPLHANAVEIEGRIFAFMGASGAGKSTLAAWFNDQGYRVVADDVCVVDQAGDGVPRVYPGIGRLRLWREVLELTGRDVAHYPKSFTGANAPDKYDVPLVRPSSSDAAVPLAAVYLLDRGDTLEITQLSGVGAADAIFANTYRGALVSKTGNSKEHWMACIRLVQAIPIFRASRRWGLDQLAEQATGLLGHAVGMPRA